MACNAMDSIRTMHPHWIQLGENRMHIKYTKVMIENEQGIIGTICKDWDVAMVEAVRLLK